MKCLKRILLFWILAGFVSTPGVFAAAPMAALEKPVNEVISLLKDPAYKAPEKAEAQREKIINVVNGIFDFVEVSKRALGRGWRDFSPDQRRTFAQVFARFLAHTYYQKVRDAYDGETVVFLSQDVVNGNRAIVETKIPRKGGDIPISYRLFKKKSDWRVYDVIIEGVSLVRNYRTQFSEILSKQSPDELIATLKEKTAQQNAKE